jgi:hypothetical protein
MSAPAPFVMCRVSRIGATGGQVRGRHATSCLRCQAEAARRRGLIRQLRTLRDVVETAPAGLLPAVEFGIERTSGRTGPAQAAAMRIATAGAVAATAAGAAVLVVWRRTHSAA